MSLQPIYLTIYGLDCFEETKKNIFPLSTMALELKYHGCWLSDDARSQDINSHGINFFLLEYCTSASQWAKQNGPCQVIGLGRSDKSCHICASFQFCTKVCQRRVTTTKLVQAQSSFPYGIIFINVFYTWYSNFVDIHPTFTEVTLLSCQILFCHIWF